MPNIITGVQAIDELKLDFIKKKFMSKDDANSVFRSWSQELADDTAELYKTFLYLIYKYRSCKRAIVPTREIDEFWHLHILATRQYHEDCQRIFGEFIHHNPHGDGEDSSEADFEYTQFLVAHEFPELVGAYE